MMRRTGCAGVMIGRGALSTPWLFRDAWSLLTTGIVPPTPDEAEKIALIRRYLDLMVQFRGEHYAMVQIRRRITWFAKRLGPCKPLREAIRLAAGPAEREYDPAKVPVLNLLREVLKRTDVTQISVEKPGFKLEVAA